MSTSGGLSTGLRWQVLLSLFALAACTPRSSDYPREPISSPTSISIVHPGSDGVPVDTGEKLRGVIIHAWHPWFGVEANLFDSQVADFNKTNPWGIKVDISSQGNYAQLYTNVTASMPGTDRPQVVVSLPEYAVAWDAEGFVVDLEDYVNDPKYGLSSDDIRDIPDVFWSQDVVRGRRLGIPAERTTRLLLFNQSWAEDLDFASAPDDSTEFRTQACEANRSMLRDNEKANDGQGGWLVDTNPMTFLSWLTAFGGGVLDDASYRLLTPDNLSALTYIKQLFDDGCAWIQQPGEDATGVFASRRSLFATAGLEELSEFSRAMGSANNPDSWSALAFPGPKQNGLIVYGSSYLVLKSSTEQQLASWLFIRWLLSPENQKKWVEVTGLFPLRTSTLALLGDYASSHKQWVSAVDLLPEAQTPPQLASWRQVRIMLGDGFDAMFRSNTPAGRVAEILAIMQKAASDLSK